MLGASCSRVAKASASSVRRAGSSIAGKSAERRPSASSQPCSRNFSDVSSARRSHLYPPPEPFSSRSSNAIPLPSAVSTFGATPELLTRFLALTPAPLTLRQLLASGGQPGVAPSPAQLLQSAEYTRRELPIRLARRVGGFRALPFIVGSNPYVQRIARLYADSFDTLARFPPIRTQEENERFTQMLEELVQDHAQNVPTLARGFLECKKYMDPADVAAFLDATIHSRIAIRLIAEQHLALTSAAHPFPSEGSTHSSSSSPSTVAHHPESTAVGIIDTRLSPARMTRMCATFVHDLCEGTLGNAPDLIIEGDKDATYTGVSVHLEYVMTELLKNSYRATAEKHGRRGGSLPPVVVTIAKSANHLSLRIRDQGGGINPRNLPHVFSYAFTTASEPTKNNSEDEDESEGGPYAMQAVGGTGGDALAEMGKMGLASGLGTLAGLGYGLPLSRIYATYFGGGSALDVVSLYGHGCDTFVKLPRHIETSDVVI